MAALIIHLKTQTHNVYSTIKDDFDGGRIFIYLFYSFPGCWFHATLLSPSCTWLEMWKETARKQIEQAGLILRVLPQILEKNMLWTSLFLKSDGVQRNELMKTVPLSPSQLRLALDIHRDCCVWRQNKVVKHLVAIKRSGGPPGR